LALAGVHVSSEKLERLTQGTLVGEPPLAYAQRKSPVAFLEDIFEKMKSRGGPALECVSVTGDRSINNPKTRPIMCELLKAGLWIAVTSPYPNGNYSLGSFSVIPSLARTYNGAFSRACGLAKHLKNLMPDFAHQIAVMRLNGQTPDSNQNFCRLASPIIGIADNRPCLFYYPAVASSGTPSEIEIATYVRYGGNRPDQWLVAYPSAGNTDEQERASDIRDNWFDYFGDVISAWEASLIEGKWKLEQDPKKHWYKYEIDESDTGTAQTAG